MAGAKAVPPAVNGWSAAYIEQQYELYRSDPNGVPADLRSFFQGFDLAQAGELRLFPGASGNGAASVASPPARAAATTPLPVPADRARVTPPRGQPAGRASHFQAVVDDLITAYRDQGHLASRLDPFGRERPRPESLSLEYHGLSDADLGREVDAEALGFQGAVPLRDVVRRLEQIYCGTIGVEFMHIQDLEQRAWLLERFESMGGRMPLDRGQRAHLLELLTRAETFEKFLGKRYPGEKRFSLEGSESLIPCLEQVIEGASDAGVEEIVFGMAHRGRLNVLNNILGKTYKQIFTEFEDIWEEDFVDGGGDVKYHRGYSGTRRFPNGRMIHLAMASNPSHLEAVDAVVLGRCRAKQRLRGDSESRARVISVLVHGDAAVAGQGIVAECLNFSGLEGYTVGGCVHIVVNNQIGFTTLPEDARSSRYCTDIGKAIDAPIFHVNGDDPEAVVTCARMAIEYRQRFQRDCFIDIWCFRRFGHNEQDEQSFTQPILAKLIAKKDSTLTVYAQKLLAEGMINEADIQAIRHRLDEALEQAQAAAKTTPYDPTIDPGSARWAHINPNKFTFDPVATGAPRDLLAEVAAGLGRVPEGFNVNRKLVRLLDERRALVEPPANPGEPKISYADAESLAFGTLLLEGHPIRLSGQDCRRGTFSHRHAALRDAETGEMYIPLNNIRAMGEPGTDQEPGTPGPDGRPRQARFCVYDSPLSEASVLAFDYGYSLADPNMLVCWEAQFGDFVNGAQVIIDQFLVSAEQKWERWSGLTMLLPHGYEGAGPEHSSARLERFLELCGNNNIIVVYPTTGAQCFHMLRRQVKAPYRKPMVVMTPKSLLRKPTSHLEELISGRFHEILDDPNFVGAKDSARKRVKQVQLVSGKLYYELHERREELGRDDVALVRIEQLYPFHADLLGEILSRYPKSAELVYVQEEPRNMGAYLFVADRIDTTLGLGRPRYIGRPASGSPAVGSKRQHKVEQEQILTAAIGGHPAVVRSPSDRETASLKHAGG